jgi:parallel beta-helix repeat protein
MKKSVVILIAAALSMSVQAGHKIVVPKDAPNIRTALDRAEEGDTVFVCKGTYKESIVLRDGVALIGESASETVIHGKGSGDVVKGADRAIIKNFTVENGDKGIMCESVSMTVEHNFVRGNKGTGIHCLVTLPLIRNNVVFQNGWTGIFCETVRSLNTLIENNVIAANGYSGIMLAGSSVVLVQDNVFLRNKQFGIWVNDDARKSRIVYNDFFMNRASYNSFAQIDRTNFAIDPQLFAEGGSITSSIADILSKPASVLHGRGKDNKDVGITDEHAFAPSAPPSETPAAAQTNDVTPPPPSPAPATPVAPVKSEETKAPVQPAAATPSPDTTKKIAPTVAPAAAPAKVQTQPAPSPAAVKAKKPAPAQKVADSTKKAAPAPAAVPDTTKSKPTKPTGAK